MKSVKQMTARAPGCIREMRLAIGVASKAGVAGDGGFVAVARVAIRALLVLGYLM